MRFHIEGLEVFFPYDYIYKEQYSYMVELKHALDAKGSGLLEMPTGTGKTVTILSLVTSYQLAHPEVGKLIYCTRTVPEITKVMEELKAVLKYRREELQKDALRAGLSEDAATAAAARGDILALCLASRRNLCVHPEVMREGDRERADALCRSRTASWVRARAARDPSVATCDFFEGYDATGTDADLRGVLGLDDLKALGARRKWCPYFMARHAISFANVVVYNYQYMLDPKVAGIVSREMEETAIVIFDEAHNIDNVCIEALSVNLDRRLLEASARNLGRLEEEVKRLKEHDAARLRDEYDRLMTSLTAGGALQTAHVATGTGTAAVAAAAAAAAAPTQSSSAAAIAASATASAAGAGAGGGGVRSGRVRGGEEMLASPVLPDDVLQEAIPGTIRNAELFVRFMRHVVRFLRARIQVQSVESVTPSRFLEDIRQQLSVDTRPLRFAYSRLNSLLRTLEVTEMDDFLPVQFVADFVTILATYPEGFMVILEPYDARTPHVPDPLMQLACLDASLAIRPVFRKFRTVVLTSGTLSPLDMYPKMLDFHPVIRASFEMSISRPCIAPMIVASTTEQGELTTRLETRKDKGIQRAYGHMLVQLCQVVPDGVVVFFPSYAYLEEIVATWHADGTLGKVQRHKLMFFETKDIMETSLAIENYQRACDSGRGAIFLSIARGKVAEGVDFDRHYGRLVVLIGIPYQYTESQVLKARLAYLRDRYRIHENDFLTFDALRQASQCVGRVIRSKRDYGVMVFADARYGRYDKRSKLPQWITQFLPDEHAALTPDMAVRVCRKFLKEMALPRDANEGLGVSLLSRQHLDRLASQAETHAAPGLALVGPSTITRRPSPPLPLLPTDAAAATTTEPSADDLAILADIFGDIAADSSSSSSSATAATAATASSTASGVGDALADRALRALGISLTSELLDVVDDAGLAGFLDTDPAPPKRATRSH